MGSAPMGSLQIACFFAKGLFGYSHQPTFVFAKVRGRTFFPDLSIFIPYAAAPLVLSPFVRNQGVQQRPAQLRPPQAELAHLAQHNITQHDTML